MGFKGRGWIEIIASIGVGAGYNHIVEVTDLPLIGAPDSNADLKQNCIAEIGRERYAPHLGTVRVPRSYLPALPKVPEDRVITSAGRRDWRRWLPT